MKASHYKLQRELLAIVTLSTLSQSGIVGLVRGCRVFRLGLLLVLLLLLLEGLLKKMKVRVRSHWNFME